MVAVVDIAAGADVEILVPVAAAAVRKMSRDLGPVGSFSRF
jgi:hypothetical protein